MKTRALALTAVALVASAGVSLAAPKPRPVCNLLLDPTGDTFVARAQESAGAYGPHEDTFDITSADIATDAKTITGVIRAKKVAKSNNSSPVGNGYAVEFKIPGSAMTMSLRATFSRAGDLYEASYKDASVPNSPSVLLAVATGVLDEKKNEVRISAPLSVFDSQGGIKPGNKITDLNAFSGRAVPPALAQPGQPISPRFVFADAAIDGPKPYTAGQRSCVPVGK